MPEIIPSAADPTVVVHRHGLLTWISLACNALVLLLILIGIVCHPHRPPPPGAWGGHFQRFEGEGRGPGDFERRDFGPMHPEWGNRCRGGEYEDKRGFDGADEEGPGPRPELEGPHGWGGPGDFDRPDHRPMMPPSSEAMTDRFMLVMTDKLALTDPESAQIRPIVQEQIAQFQKDMETQKAAHQKMIDDAKAKIRPILNPDQQKQFDQLTAKLGGPALENPASK